MNQKPQYVIRIDDGYYSRTLAWQTCSRELATEMTHKVARAVCGKLKRLRYAASVEPVTPADKK